MKNFNTLKLYKLGMVLLLSVSFAASSCSKKSNSGRSATKVSGVNLNPTVTQTSQNISSNLNVNYNITKSDYPTGQSGQFNVKSEIQTPNGQFITVTTSHQSETDSIGSYTDPSQPNVKLDLRARCVGVNCEKYVLLMTVVRDGYAYHQVAAISYSQDCRFSYDLRSYQVANLFQSVSEVISNYYNVQPTNDCAAE